MKKKILIIAMLGLSYGKAHAQYLGLSNDEFAKLKTLINNDASVKKAFDSYKNKSDKALNDQPNPIDKIRSEGLLAGDPLKIKTQVAVEDVSKIFSLALVYRIDDNKACLDRASAYLLAWAKVNRSNGDPIDDTKLEELVTGYDMIRNDVTADVQKATDKWLLSVLEDELNSKYMAPGKGTAHNNWNSHRIKILAMIAYTLHNTGYEKTINKELETQIALNLYPDGSGYDFKERDALHYHIYTLEPLITAASVIYRATGKDYFNYESDNGSSIKKSTDFLVPFVTGEKTHQEFLNSNVAFDKKRAANGEKDYAAGALFKTATGIHVLEQAAYFDSKYQAAAQKADQGGSHDSDWDVVLNKVRKPFGTK